MVAARARTRRLRRELDRGRTGQREERDGGTLRACRASERLRSPRLARTIRLVERDGLVRSRIGDRSRRRACAAARTSRRAEVGSVAPIRCRSFLEGDPGGRTPARDARARGRRSASPRVASGRHPRVAHRALCRAGARARGAHAGRDRQRTARSRARPGARAGRASSACGAHGRPARLARTGCALHSLRSPRNDVRRLRFRPDAPRVVVGNACHVAGRSAGRAAHGPLSAGFATHSSARRTVAAMLTVPVAPLHARARPRVHVRTARQPHRRSARPSRIEVIQLGGAPRRATWSLRRNHRRRGFVVTLAAC